MRKVTFREWVGQNRTPYRTDFSYDIENKPTQIGFGLTAAERENTKVTYFYDGLGRTALRAVKVNGTPYAANYTLHGKNIVHMTQGNDELHFWYDASGKPALVEYNGAKYGYLQNLQVDIVGIIDSFGNEVVKYTYDVWGKPFTPTGSMKDSIGKLNPFRYCGYVYDEETGLYYLRSRYYSVSTIRFLNADELIASCNLYAYSNNNPVCNLDSSGTSTQSAQTNTPAPSPSPCQTPEPGPSPVPPYYNPIMYDVPLYNQGPYNLCWATSQIMIEDYSLGISRKDEEAWNAAYTLAVDTYGTKWNDGGHPQNISRYQSSKTRAGEYLSMGKIYSLLEKPGPLYIAYANPSKGGLGHMVVLRGIDYQEGLLYVNNPPESPVVRPTENFVMVI